MKIISPTTRGLVIGMSGLFAGGVVHGLLPPGDFLARAVLTGLSCLVVSLLALLILRVVKA